MDKVNPRIFRYLGYSAFENGNIDVAIKSLESFTSNAKNKIIAKDYLYLGLARIKKGTSADGLTIDPIAFSAGIADIKKAIEMEPLAVEDLNEIAVKLFNKKLYKEATSVLELSISNKESKNYLDDNVYYGLAIYYANIQKDIVVNREDLQKADVTFQNVLLASPSYIDAYIYRARINALIEDKEVMKKNYEDFVSKAIEKGPEEIAKPLTKKKLIESYNNIATVYLTTDKVKAKENLNKSLELDPTDKRALELLAYLK
jgi:hypothetical protein